MHPATSAILKPDLCVIGGGRCGLAVASAARALGASVAIVEKDQMGGNHLYAARLMALAAAGRMAAEGARARRLGLAPAGVEVDAGRARAYAERAAKALARDMSRARFEAMGARVIGAAGRFTARDTVEAGGLAIRARHFVLATGAMPIIPPLPGLALVRHLTPRTMLGLPELPGHLAILGGGAAAVEIAQALRRLGGDVTLVAGGRVLPEIDGELAGILLDELLRDGVRVLQHAAVAHVEPQGSGVTLGLAGGGTIAASHLLIAAGRRANTEGLGLDLAGVAFDAEGVKIDASLRSLGNPRVFALGGVTGPASASFAADGLARVLLAAALFETPLTHPTPVLVNGDPEIATIGLMEEEARARHDKILISRAPFAAIDRARIEGEATGHVKLIAKKSGEILGAGIVGRGAGDLIVPFAIAIAQGLTAADLADLPVASAVRSAAAWQALAGLSAPGLRRRPLRRLLALAKLLR